MTDTDTPERNLLVIGYGSTLRCDDGVGPAVAEAIAAMNLPGVQTLACHQLLPELADAISKAGRVVFVDATVDGTSEVQLRELTAATSGQIMAHAADPQTLLALARDVFGRCPPAWWLTIPVQNTELGEEFSAVAQQGVQLAIEKIRILAQTASV
jgi:hydrogenase maturation protease